MNEQTLPLKGIRVIDYSHFLAGPHMSRCLSAMGADVIKIERPTSGDAGRASPTRVKGQSGYFLQQNMGKRGLCVNLKDARGLELMHKLTDTADVFVENYRPGALDKLGLGYAELSERNPKLVYCSVSAYGHTGPDAARPGFGLIAEAKSGAMSLIGVPGQPPPLFRMPIADMYAGMHGVSAICAALFGRVTSGRGQHIDIALYDCMVSMHDYATQGYLMSGGTELPKQTGHDLPQSTVYGVFPARDGCLVIAAQVDDSWLRLAQLIGGDAFAADTRFHEQAGRNEHRVEILDKVHEWTMSQPSVNACCAALDAAGVSAAPVQTIDQVLSDPQTLAREMVIEQQHPVLGTIKLTNLPFRFSDCDTSPSGPAPLLGQHNREIAVELGYNEADIAAMQADGVLYAEEDVVRFCQPTGDEVMTDRYAAMGNPITHSKSPLIHSTFAQQTNQDISYGLIEGPLGEFKVTVDKFRSEGARGLNITTPFKLDAFEYADELSDGARAAGAVNAMKFEAGKVYAENFDGVGLVRDIVENLDFPLAGRRVLLLGAGGASRGLVLPFMRESPSRFVIVNRTVSKAEHLARQFSDYGKVEIAGYPDLKHDAFDVVINATSASLRAELPELRSEVFGPGCLAYELSYGKGLTPFLGLAQESGAGKLADGVGMLVEQAAEAFAWWRGMRPLTGKVIEAITVPLV